jgi:uncharacterized protein (DUF433 family)
MNLIEINPHIMLGKPVLAGTRITVESLLKRLAAGEQEADILDAHPQLKPEHIRASLPLAETNNLIAAQTLSLSAAWADGE